MNYTQYKEWLLDERNDQHRVTLIEVNHSGGVLKYASKTYPDYLTDIIEPPIFDQKIGDALSVGDVSVLMPDIDLNFRGHDLIVKHGDVRDDVADFYTVYTAIINRVDYKSSGIATIRTIDNAIAYDVNIPADITYSAAATPVLAALAASGGYPAPVYSGLNTWQEWANITITLTDSNTFIDAINLIADSIYSNWYINNDGAIEFIGPYSVLSVIDINAEDIVYNSLTQVDSQPAYAHVDVLYGWTGGLSTSSNEDDAHTVESIDTLTDTGALDETYTVKSAITQLSDAQQLSGLHYIDKKVTRRTYSLDVIDKHNLIKIGNRVNIDIDGIGVCLVSRISHDTINRVATIEIIK